MANKKNTTSLSSEKQFLNAPDPKKLDECMFFKRLGFELSEEQKKFRDAIYNPNIDIIFCEAKSGSGKTTIAMTTACLMVECGLYDDIFYCFSTSGGVFEKNGFLPGSIEDKEAGFYEPCMQALTACGYQPDKCIKELNPDGAKNGTAFVSCRSHAFLRGTNIGERTILVIDEFQNFYLDEAQKTLTRVKDGSKVIVIGQEKQCDLLKHPEYSGFIPYMELFKGHPRAAICELTQNFRGWVSELADSLDVEKARNLARLRQKEKEKRPEQEENFKDRTAMKEADLD